MKLFGPKKIEGIGEPCDVEILRSALLELLPIEGEVNNCLTIATNEKFPAGFLAIWKMYAKERQEDNSFRFNYVQVTYTFNVDVDPSERAVHLKARNFMKSARIPEGEKVYYPWYSQVKIGKLSDLKDKEEKESQARVYTFSTKKMREPLVACITQHGWDAYV